MQRSTCARAATSLPTPTQPVGSRSTRALIQTPPVAGRRGTSQAVPIIAGVYGLAAAIPPGSVRRLSDQMSCAKLRAVRTPGGPGARAATNHRPVQRGGPVQLQLDACARRASASTPTGLGTPIGLGAFADRRGRTLSPPERLRSRLLGDARRDRRPAGPARHGRALRLRRSRSTRSYSDSTQDQPVSGDSQTFSESLTGLTPSTTYHYRVFATARAIRIGANGDVSDRRPAAASASFDCGDCGQPADNR